MDASNAAEKIETFRNHLIGYNPHEFNFPVNAVNAPSRESIKDMGGQMDQKPIPAANQAELNIVSDLLELLPQGFTSE